MLAAKKVSFLVDKKVVQTVDERAENLVDKTVYYSVMTLAAQLDFVSAALMVSNTAVARARKMVN